MTQAKQGYSFSNITSAATTTVKTTGGCLKRIVINKPVASAVITIYDNTTNSGTKLGTITLPATLLEDTKSLEYDVSFGTGLTIVTSQATDLTVVFN